MEEYYISLFKNLTNKWRICWRKHNRYIGDIKNIGRTVNVV